MQLNATTDYAIRMTLFLAIIGTPIWKELPVSTVAWKKITAARDMQRRHVRSGSSMKVFSLLWITHLPKKQLHRLCDDMILAHTGF